MRLVNNIIGEEPVMNLICILYLYSDSKSILFLLISFNRDFLSLLLHKYSVTND